jgi:hypothetical protein
VNRKYKSEIRPKVPACKAASAVMIRRLNTDKAEAALVDRVTNGKQCCSISCLRTLWRGKRDPFADVCSNVPSTHIQEGFGKKFLEAVLAARRGVYHTDAYSSSFELKSLLQRDLRIGKMNFKFYHTGILGDSPSVPEGIEVNTFINISCLNY